MSTGELERVNELVYRLRGAPLSRGRTATEGLLIAGEGSMLSHWTAARLHGLDGIEGRSAIDVSVGSGAVPRPLPGLNFHRSSRESGGFVWKSGWPIGHSQRQRFDRDARQRSRLAGLGWRCVIVTHNTFKDGSWLEDLLALLDPQSELGLY